MIYRAMESKKYLKNQPNAPFTVSRKDEAVNRPKMEFVPKTLADLHIEGIHDLNNGRRYGSTQSLSRPRQHIPPSSSVGDLSNADPFRAWEMPTPPKANRIEQNHRPVPGFKPHPAPRNQFNGRDPWSGEFGFVCWFIFYLTFDHDLHISIQAFDVILKWSESLGRITNDSEFNFWMLSYLR